ncbi:glycosyltransferase group 2 [alpha proteobacterium HIMB59]|nr:glycosyltransferase group 2 [alpha proteobacterium HIMB59]
MFNKKLSIISVLMNNEDTILKMKNSVTKQNLKDYEHIFCLSKRSKDNTSNIVNKYLTANDIVFYEAENTVNKFDAINQAIKISKGRYLFLLHGDDYIINENFFFEIFNIISKENDKGIFYTNINIVDKYDEIKRNWIAINDDNLNLSNAWLIPHTGILIDRYKVKDKDLYYNSDFFISGDLLYILKLIKKYQRLFKKINVYSVNMLNTGDSSKFKNILEQFYQDKKILKRFFPKNYLKIIFLKKFSKVYQFFV